MQAVADGLKVAEGGPIPLEYWQAISSDKEEASALYALDAARHGGSIITSARDLEDM